MGLIHLDGEDHYVNEAPPAPRARTPREEEAIKRAAKAMEEAQAPHICDPHAPALLEKYAKVMAAYRLSKLTVGNLTLEMSPLGFTLPEPVSATNDSPEGERVPTDEELTLWSAGGPLPDVKAEAPKE